MLKKLLMLLPRIHMYAHKDLCQAVYSLAYAAGFGLTHGEGVETPWAELNISSLATREMSGGGCEDALNSLFNFWNWSKDLGMAQYLLRKLHKAYDGQRRTTKYFAGLCALAGPTNVAAWLALPFDNQHVG
ncbi:hypothetical protein GSI_10367 [Ganoderma sinense ZZ0214-1]|uniref:Uncharacterized protein n=1 Tax=Ganoderma sinense ZZ0214-1 TaxID=1077348 RepID=A0A2G8S0B9_9APHY|nr:hypothetical protein GSI_10367 [Ganoderma sinense ZZ0214-1]